MSRSKVHFKSRTGAHHLAGCSQVSSSVWELRWSVCPVIAACRPHANRQWSCGCMPHQGSRRSRAGTLCATVRFGAGLLGGGAESSFALPFYQQRVVAVGMMALRTRRQLAHVIGGSISVRRQAVTRGSTLSHVQEAGVEGGRVAGKAVGGCSDMEAGRSRRRGRRWHDRKT